MTRAINVFLVFLIIPITVNAAPKTDVVVFKNGDRMTGEFKKVTRGILSLSTDAAGTIEIEWPSVASVQSAQHVQVETDAGVRYFGRIGKSDQSGYLEVNTDGGTQQISMIRVVAMAPIDSTWKQALNVDVSFGYNFAKANSVEQGNVEIDADYRTQLRIFSLAASTNISGSSDQPSSKRADLSLQYTRLLEDRWFYLGNLNFEQNDELDLDLRTSIGGGMGRYFVQNNHVIFSAQAGLLVSREKVTGVAGSNNFVEVALGLDWDWFRFDNPELDWSTSFDFFPNLTESGRRRAEFETSLTWEIIGDLDWVLSFYSSYDNKPNATGASDIDYGVNTMISYEFL